MSRTKISTLENKKKQTKKQKQIIKIKTESSKIHYK